MSDFKAACGAFGTHSLKDGLCDILRRMWLIRQLEEHIAEAILSGDVLCPCHLYIGQEAVAVGICAHLHNEDFVFSTHRSHGHYLAKGGDLNGMLAEVFCRATGCSGGWGGSMHVIDESAGLPGSSAIVAGTIPLAVGAALAFATSSESHVSVVFFGDGATNEGVFYESLNLAALLRLPVVFVCENNLYSTHLPIDRCLADTDIPKKASSLGVPSERVDGNDVLAVATVAVRAIERARIGEGPTFIEAQTYRWRGHVGPHFDVDKGLRSKDELDSWMRRCPIKMLQARMVESGITSTDDIARIADEIASQVGRAVALARESRFPLGDAISVSPPGGLI